MPAAKERITLSTARELIAEGKATKEQLLDRFEIEDDEPTPVEELLFGRPALKLRPMKRDLIRHKWERFISSSMKT